MQKSNGYFLELLMGLLGFDFEDKMDDSLNMMIKLIYDDPSLLFDLYDELIKPKNDKSLRFLMSQLIITYTHYNANKDDKELSYLANNSEKDTYERFKEDKAFGLDLLYSYILYLDEQKYPDVLEENYPYTLAIDLRYGKAKLKTLEDVVTEAFIKVIYIIRGADISEDLIPGLITSVVFGGKLMALNVDIEKEVEIISSYRNYLIKSMYSTIYAHQVGTPDLEFDDNFMALFDEHIFNNSFDLDNFPYSVMFVQAYLKCLSYNGDIYLSDDQLKYIRGINPLFRY